MKFGMGQPVRRTEDVCLITGAVTVCAIDHIDMPATSLRVWQALQEAA